jgi:hypothetical protein
MRKRKVLLTIVFVALVSSLVNGIGISPARQILAVPENGSFSENVRIWLFPPQGIRVKLKHVIIFLKRT